MKTSTKLKAAIFVVGVAFVGFLSYELFYWLTHVYEFDARIKTELTTLSSRVDASIEKIYVKEGDEVSKGQLLVALDSEVERLRIEGFKVDLARERARVPAHRRRDARRRERLRLLHQHAHARHRRPEHPRSALVDG